MAKKTPRSQPRNTKKKVFKVRKPTADRFDQIMAEAQATVDTALIRRNGQLEEWARMARSAAGVPSKVPAGVAVEYDANQRHFRMKEVQQTPEEPGDGDAE